ncbi:MAG: pyridoxal phosphate-dependent aminotransferase [Planctomycetota bacterium]
MELSRRMSAIAGSATLAALAKAKEMKAAGIDVASLTAGEPDFDTPQHIKVAALKALERGATKYTPTSGLPALREAVAEEFREAGIKCEATDVLVSCGAKHSIYNALLAILNEGDEAIVPAPYWVSYPEQVKCGGGTVKVVATNEGTGFKMTPRKLAAAIGPKTKVVILNSPSNPTGSVYTREELEALGNVLVKHDGVLVLSDEIYNKLVYEELDTGSIAAIVPKIADRTITVNGVSKTYAMTGWRIGYLTAPREIIAIMSRLQDHSTSGPTTVSQEAALAALTGDQSCVEEMRTEFDRRRGYIHERLNALPKVRCAKPMGAFYVFPNVSEYFGRELEGKRIQGSTDFCGALLSGAHVAIVPGEGFGADECVRISYAASMETIEKAMDRMQKFLA